MAGDSRSPRKAAVAKTVDLDEQLWPINCAALILAGFVAGIVIATSSFEDPRLFYNGWVRLFSVALMVVFLFLSVMWLQGRMLRRLQLCILVSLLVHLALFLWLYHEKLGLTLSFAPPSSAEAVDPDQRDVIPEYHWTQIEQPVVAMSFEQPVETEVPENIAAEKVDREPPPFELPAEKPAVEPSGAQRPNAAELRRAELSAPRRAEQAAGGQISRQQWKQQPQPGQSIPLPEIKAESERAAGTLNARVADVVRQEAPGAMHERKTFQEPESQRQREAVGLARQAGAREPAPDTPTTPNPARELFPASDVARTEATVPQPAAIAQQPKTAELQPSPAVSAKRQSAPPAAAKPAAEPLPMAGAVAQFTRASAPDRRTDRQPELTPAPRSSLARLPGPADSLASAAEPQGEAAATASGSPDPQLDAVPGRVVRRPASASLAGTPGAATAEPVAADPAVSAPRGQPRRPQQDVPQAIRAQPTGIADLSRRPVSSLAVGSTVAEDAAVARAGPSDQPSLAAIQPGSIFIAKATSAARSGRAVLPSAQPVVGSGPDGTSGTADRIGVAGPVQVTRQEAILSGLTSGGGTTQPARATLGGTLAAESDAPVADAAATAQGGGNASGKPLEAATGQQRRQPSGLPGSRDTRASAGAAESLTKEGKPLPSAVARRAAASETRDGGAGVQPDLAATLARANSGARLPAGALVDSKAEKTPGTGDAGGADAAAGSSGGTTAEPSGPASSAAVAARALGATLPGAAPLRPGGPDDLAPGPVATAPQIGRSGSRAGALLANAGPEGVAGPARAAARKLAAEGVADFPEMLTSVSAADQPGAGSNGVLQVAAIGPQHQMAGLPVQYAAPPGPGGLGYDPSPQVGIPSRFARPESDVVHAVSRRFVIERSGGGPTMDGTVSEPTEAYGHRDPSRRPQTARARGGSGGTERAVEVGLDFFARTQFPDGRWSLHRLPAAFVKATVDSPAEVDALVAEARDILASRDVERGLKQRLQASLEKHRRRGSLSTAEKAELLDFVASLGQMEADTAATGLALLTYLGAGYTHLDDKHRTVVRRGVEWLVGRQKPDGDLFTGGSKYAHFYSHGIAAIALCEAYGMTQDPELREPARKAIDFIVKTQNPTRGGWRYDVQPDTGRSTETDTSVTGWQLMALKSAQMAGLEVHAEVFEKIGAWLDSARARGESGRYIYNPHADETKVEQRDGLRPNLAMTSEAMLMRMYLGAKRDDSQLLQGADHLKANLPSLGTAERPLRDCYYWYYATQAMFQVQGDYWTAWNDQMRQVMQTLQVEKGELAGSWHPDRPVADRWAHAGGRHYVTAMHLLMLEVYYRHLPLFQELSK